MALQLVDIGVNLGHASFRADREEVIRRAVAAGVEAMIVTGASLQGSEEALELAGSHPGTLYSTAGIHPHDARHGSVEAIERLRELAQRPEVVAVGECGLDFNRDFSPRPLQERWFEAQVQLAGELNRPLFLHERDAHQRFVEILARYRDQLDAAVVHCFTGTAEELDVYLAMDLHIGITGWICDERRGLHLRDLICRIPLERLMLETDAPFLTPRNMAPRPKSSRNEPAFLPHVLRAVASSLGKPVEEVAAATTRTARAFFRIG